MSAALATKRFQRDTTDVVELRLLFISQFKLMFERFLAGLPFTPESLRNLARVALELAEVE